MNITYFIPHLSLAGGMERVLSIKANYLADILGYNVTIITYRQYDNPIYFNFSPKIKFIHFDLHDPTFILNQLSVLDKRKAVKKFMQTYKKLTEEYLFKNKTDIAISMFLGAEYKFLPLIEDGSIKIVEFHFDFFCTQYRLLEGKINFPKLISYYQIKKEQKILKKFDRLIPLTEEDAANWKRHFTKITAIPNPITIKSIKATDLSAKKVIAVGRLVEQKGFDMLIDAWKIVCKKNPDWKLDIYGEGALEKELKEQIIKNNLEQEITIYPNTKNISEKYAEHSIFVLSSRHEGFVLALLEAMSLGLACVSFDCKHGPKQMINEGENGFLVKLGDIQALASKINLLIDKENLRIAFADNAKRSSQRYSIEKVMTKWTDLFKVLKNEH